MAKTKYLCLETVAFDSDEYGVDFVAGNVYYGDKETGYIDSFENGTSVLLDMEDFEHYFKECPKDMVWNINGMKFGLDYEEDYVVWLLDCIPNMEGSAVIPEEVAGIPVKWIAYDTFRGCEHLTSIEIPESVKYIGGMAFEDCELLEAIKLPEKLESIGPCVFSGCSSLKSIEIPDGVGQIMNGAFWGCTNLVSVKLPDNLREIGEAAFEGCVSLKIVKCSQEHFEFVSDYFKEEGFDVAVEIVDKKGIGELIADASARSSACNSSSKNSVDLIKE